MLQSFKDNTLKLKLESNEEIYPHVVKIGYYYSSKENYTNWEINIGSRTLKNVEKIYSGWKQAVAATRTFKPNKK